VSSFAQEDQDKLLEETILQWRALGPTAAWDAAFDLLGWWYAVRGLDPETQRIDRGRVEIHTVPWRVEEATPQTDTPSQGSQLA